MIPKIIHQIFPKDENNWHPIWKRCFSSWEKNFPRNEYNHVYWNDDDDLSNFVKDYYPMYFCFFENLPSKIMKIDLAKYFILHQYGGIYVDMDIFCYKNFYHNLTENFHVVENLNDEEKVSNCLMASEEKNQFFMKCVENSKFLIDKLTEDNFFEKYNWKKYSHIFTDSVLNCTGPHLLSKTFFDDSSYNQTNILSSKYYTNKFHYYGEELYTKHISTLLWVHEFDENKFGRNLTNSELTEVFERHKKINDLNEFDFYKNYVS